MKHQESENRPVATNRKASFDYSLERTFQAGIVLQGSEIKSLRARNLSLGDGYVQERNGELWLLGVHIAPYEKSDSFEQSDPVRPRKLLLHRKEINQILSRIKEKGYTLIPTKVYIERGRAKVEVALAKGKKQYDKRETIQKRDAERAIRRAIKEDI
ncbi:MAG TPA: SsrA-binding protein SmpB [Aggregatilineales bacterium]|nr:SsrA-binding protein SmpB [Aggregatilineales bacterium]